MGESSALEAREVLKLLTSVGAVEFHDVVIKAKKIIIRPARGKEG